MTSKKQNHPERTLTQSERRSRRARPERVEGTCGLLEVPIFSEAPAKYIQLACLTALWGLAANPQSLAACSTAQRATVIRVDPILHQRWAITSDCDQPAHPAHAKPVTLSAAEPVHATQTKAPVTIHAGDQVRVWAQQPNLTIETSGIAEESGAIGSPIHIRLAQLSADGTFTQVPAIVRGPYIVEMQP